MIWPLYMHNFSFFLIHSMFFHLFCNCVLILCISRRTFWLKHFSIALSYDSCTFLLYIFLRLTNIPCNSPYTTHCCSSNICISSILLITFPIFSKLSAKFYNSSICKEKTSWFLVYEWSDQTHPSYYLSPVGCSNSVFQPTR